MTFGRSVGLSCAAVDQAIKKRALELLQARGFKPDSEDFMLRAIVARLPDGGADVLVKE